jgi:hypothetical protein
MVRANRKELAVMAMLFSGRINCTQNYEERLENGNNMGTNGSYQLMLTMGDIKMNSRGYVIAPVPVRVTPFVWLRYRTRPGGCHPALQTGDS